MYGADGDTTETSRFNPYYSVSFGTVIQVRDVVQMKPSFMLKYINDAGMLLDLNYSVLIREMIWTGGFI